MFVILQDNQFVSFWFNNPEDFFIDATIRNLFLDSEKTKFIFFKDLKEVPESFEIVNNNLVINNSEFAGEVFFENGILLK
jgi:hypothetical protein